MSYSAFLTSAVWRVPCNGQAYGLPFRDYAYMLGNRSLVDLNGDANNKLFERGSTPNNDTDGNSWAEAATQLVLGGSFQKVK